MPVFKNSVSVNVWNPCMISFPIYSLSDHLNKLAKLEDDQDGSCSKEFGINSKSALLDLKFFDFCSGSLLPDVMHDVLEGALQYELKLLLKYCINDKQFFQVQYVFL